VPSRKALTVVGVPAALAITAPGVIVGGWAVGWGEERREHEDMCKQRKGGGRRRWRGCYAMQQSGWEPRQMRSMTLLPAWQSACCLTRGVISKLVGCHGVGLPGHRVAVPVQQAHQAQQT
jgi:hypothetical protein